MISAKEARELANKNGALLDGVYASIQKTAELGNTLLHIPVDFGDVDLFMALMRLKDSGYHVEHADYPKEYVRRVTIAW